MGAKHVAGLLPLHGIYVATADLLAAGLLASEED